MASKPPVPAGAHPLDALAQQQGFPDYATYLVWSRGRAKSASIDPSKITKTGPATAQQAPNNWLMSLLHKIPPFSIIGQVSDAYGNATGTN